MTAKCSLDNKPVISASRIRVVVKQRVSERKGTRYTLKHGSQHREGVQRAGRPLSTNNRRYEGKLSTHCQCIEEKERRMIL